MIAVHDLHALGRHRRAELLEAQRNRKSEQLSKEQLALFEAELKAKNLTFEPMKASTVGSISYFSNVPRAASSVLRPSPVT